MVIVWNRIMLLVVVGGNEVMNFFMVIEVYKKEVLGDWKLLNLFFIRFLIFIDQFDDKVLFEDDQDLCICFG